MVYIATGQHLVSKGVDRLKDEVTARGEAIKVAGSGVVDTVVCKYKLGINTLQRFNKLKIFFILYSYKDFWA